MVHTIRMLTANGFAQKANLTTDDTDEEALSSKQSAVSQDLFTAKDAKDAKENGVSFCFSDHPITRSRAITRFLFGPI